MKKNITSLVKKLTAGVLTVGLLVAGMAAFSATASTSENDVVEIYQLAPETSSLMESYVIKTPNGKLVVIDGGIDGAGDEIGVTATSYITAALRSIAGVGEGEHFTVDAWFVSHGHIDHYLELAKILCAYTDETSYTGETVTLADSSTKTWKAAPDTNFTIKNFYLDFPEESEWSKATEFTQSPYFAKFKEGLNKYAAANQITLSGDSYYDDLNGKVVNQDAIDNGLTITIDGVDFEILQTWSTGDGQVNDNSMVIRVVYEGQSALFLNDATVASGNRLLDTYSYRALQSDIVQLGHHGQNGCSQAFYEEIGAQSSIRLWAASLYVWNGASSNLQTKEVRSWFGLAEEASAYVATEQDIVAALYDAYPTDKTSVAAWNAVIDGMKVTLQAKATESVDSTVVICEEYTKDKIEEYWKADSKTAPLKSGYVFGGWFKETTEADANKESLTLNGTAGYYAPLTESEMLTEIPDTAYAKFVPAQVLSVKAQNQSKVTADYIANLNKDLAEGAEKDYFWVRVLTSLDSKNYAKIGFDIYLANKIQLTKTDGSPLETTRMYEAVIEEVDEVEKTRYASDIFGAPSKYVTVWQLNKIDTASNAEKIIYVRPYWYTKDGTKVLGIAKYVHIEDEYLNYINIPVNILGEDELAAGAVTMLYDLNSELELISDDEDKYFEEGRILPEMKVHHDTKNKTFNMVGNAATVDAYNSTESIYANIRFKKPTTDADTTFKFDMKLGEFCDWDYNTNVTANLKVWDIEYEVEATTNE